MDSIIVIFIVAALVGLAVGYIRSARKKGVKCIGCPDGVRRGGGCAGCSGNCCGHPKI